MSTTSIDETKLEAFMGQAVTDMGATISAPLFKPESTDSLGEGAAVGLAAVFATLRDSCWGWLVSVSPWTLPGKRLWL